MAVDDGNTGNRSSAIISSSMKGSDVDLIYGDEDNFDQLNSDDLTGDLGDEDLNNEDEAAILNDSRNGSSMGGDEGMGVEESLRQSVVDDFDADDRGDQHQPDADDLLYDAVITERTSPLDHHEDDSAEFAASPNSRSVDAIVSSYGIHTTVTGSGTMHQAQRKNSCYVGNLTWWTTDQDLADSVNGVGIGDLIDVKFYENRANGQSKGFALVSFNSEHSVRQCSERLPARQIHGQIPVVMPYTKQSLAQFEAAARKPGERADSGSGSTGMERAPQTTPNNANTGRGPSASEGCHSVCLGSALKIGQQFNEKNAPTFLGTIRIGAGGATRIDGGIPGINTPPQLGGAMLSTSGSRVTVGMPPAPPGVVLRTPPSSGVLPPGIPPPPGVRPPGGMPPSSAIGVPPPIVNRPPPSMQTGSSGVHHSMRPSGLPPPMHPMHHHHHHGTGIPPPGVPPPGSHANPNFYPGLAAAQQQHSAPTPLSESEFEEIMNRNRTVSSSAITRAVSDAGAGDYASAIETLVTAISLIRQSKVAHDERCKVLIGSLQDTLHGVEAKSYGSIGVGGSHHGGGISRRSKERASGRDRSRSRDRGGGGGSKRRHRSRSRSRSRDRYADEYSPRRSRRY